MAAAAAATEEAKVQGRALWTRTGSPLRGGRQKSWLLKRLQRKRDGKLDGVALLSLMGTPRIGPRRRGTGSHPKATRVQAGQPPMQMPSRVRSLSAKGRRSVCAPALRPTLRGGLTLWRAWRAGWQGRERRPRPRRAKNRRPARPRRLQLLQRPTKFQSLTASAAARRQDAVRRACPGRQRWGKGLPERQQMEDRLLHGTLTAPLSARALLPPFVMLPQRRGCAERCGSGQALGPIPLP
mmetsp:Transcript_14227/g.40317  ORF Transcript_14227/g.40317 Transcript_14227/m.40317 type:complete len:239 (+) Transcript_14227:661-1377(+)